MRAAIMMRGVPEVTFNGFGSIGIDQLIGI